MAILKKDYDEMPEYWDYQRKVEYNKEKVYEIASNFYGKVYNDDGLMSDKEMIETLWTRVPSSEYEEPPKDWIPKNDNYKFEWEIK